jgi:Subunit ChlI of Mg-chelatase
MFVCRARSLSLFGIDALPVEVEVDVSSGLPGFSIVGLPDAAVQEARERVRVAISNSGYKFPMKKVIVKILLRRASGRKGCFFPLFSRIPAFGLIGSPSC